MMPNLIQSKSDWDVFLQKTLQQTVEFQKLDPSWSLLKQVRAQLEFMQECTEHGRAPTPDEVARVNLGPIAVKNFDDTHPEYANWLMELFGSFRHWERLT